MRIMFTADAAAAAAAVSNGTYNGAIYVRHATRLCAVKDRCDDRAVACNLVHLR